MTSYVPAARRAASLQLVLRCLFVAAAVFPLRAVVTLGPIPGYVEFDHATATGALRYACAPDSAELEPYYSAKGLPFATTLVRAVDQRGQCHIYFEPSAPGFRALPDDRPVTGLSVAVDPLSFIVGRPPTGDSLDVAKAVLTGVPQTLDVTIRVGGPFSHDAWPAARTQQFAGSPHHITVRDSGHAGMHPWAQDHIKPGEIGGHSLTLTPWRLFEGREEDGKYYEGMLAAGDDPLSVRSKLSWEGGDLLFAKVPVQPTKVVLVYGGSARDYWGRSLTVDEFEYVLRLEFGADYAIDASAPGTHADYAVAFLPQDGIAVVSSPVAGMLDIFRAGASALQELYGDKAPARLAALANYAPDSGSDPAAELVKLRAELAALDAELQALPPYVDAELDAALDAYATENCPAGWSGCLDPPGQVAMLAKNPELLRRLSAYASRQFEWTTVGGQIFALMKGQVPGEPLAGLQGFDEIARQLGGMGFKILRLPFLTAPGAAHDWPGIAYTNMLVAGMTMFVPTFGLGSAELGILEALQQFAPKGYSVVPVYARAAVARNGGVHCVFAIQRETSPAAQPTQHSVWPMPPSL